MAWHTNKAGTFWGCYSTFAAEANCSRQAVKENAPRLVELGLITVIGEKPTKNGPCHFYKMNLDAIRKLIDQGVELPTEDDQVAEQRHQGVELPSTRALYTPHQVVEHTKNSSLNSSFLNSSWNSSIKSREHDDSIDSISHKTSSQSQKHHLKGLPEPMESVPPPPPVHPASPPNVSDAPCKSPKPVCKRLLCGGPLKPNGECKKCGASSKPDVAPVRVKAATAVGYSADGEEVEYELCSKCEKFRQWMGTDLCRRCYQQENP